MTRILAFDTSMSSPGAALVEIRRVNARIIDVSHVTTVSSQPHGLRAEIVEAWATLFIAKHGAKFDEILREDFVGRTSRQNHPVFSAWGAIDQALNKFGLNFTHPAISQSKVKRLVVGNGKAEKSDVERAVRELTGYTGEFATDDCSDAAAVALAWAIEKGLIKEGDF
ncbi:crossover junction endodeoxyribonuclease RuvC [Aeribacillus sp. FSL K6-1121]|uniref:crossover junction endodeoxyribonuclease RuvC n=1 Tax=Aeribacillus sp. FSL K6-1121 TaxID=2954745 RepID=UPI0030F50252